MSDELKPCPFCGSEAGVSKGGRALCSNEDCIACELFAPVEDWNRRAQPAEAEGVDFGFDDRSVKVSQEAYSIFLEREQHHLAALSAVTAERDGLAAARMAYANEFAPDENGDPDVGSVHANIRALKAERDQLRAEVEALREKADKYSFIERVMEMLECDEREGGIWTACTLLLISSAHKMNSSKSVVDQDGVTVKGEHLGNWRVTVERIDAAMAAKEA